MSESKYIISSTTSLEGRLKIKQELLKLLRKQDKSKFALEAQCKLNADLQLALFTASSEQLQKAKAADPDSQLSQNMSKIFNNISKSSNILSDFGSNNIITI